MRHVARARRRVAARACGKHRLSITVQHVLPNILGVLVVQATIQFALAILAEAALSYLGLGTQPPLNLLGDGLRDLLDPRGA